MSRSASDEALRPGEGMPSGMTEPPLRSLTRQSPSASSLHLSPVLAGAGQPAAGAERHG